MRLFGLILAFLSTTGLAATGGPSGRYESPCIPEEGGGSHLEAWVFANVQGRFFHQKSTYSDTGCQNIVETVAPAGTYVLRPGSRPGEYTIDLHVVRPENVAPEYTVLKLDHLSLFLGQKTDELDGSTAALRPTEFDESVEFTFQP